jgi:hypothetical protein
MRAAEGFAQFWICFDGELICYGLRAADIQLIVGTDDAKMTTLDGFPAADEESATTHHDFIHRG